MRTIFQIARSELNSLFSSPIAWLVLAIYTFQLSFGFTDMLYWKLKDVVLEQTINNLTSNLFVSGFGSPLFNVAISSLFLYIPLLTMGLMSKEYSSGSIKLLLSSPITGTQIILGKYLSMLIYGLILILIIAVYIVFGVFIIKDIDLPLLISGLAGIYLLICLYSAIGLFFSCITSYQIIAALASLVVMIFFQLVGGLFQTIDFIRDITFWMSIGSHGLINGLIGSDSIVYYLLLSAMFVSFSILNIRFQRQSISFFKKGIQYVGVFVMTVAIGYITSRPQITYYWDVTRFEQMTLTPKSQEILARFKGDPVLTSYVNFMGDPHLISKGYPANRNADKRAFGQYVRFKPNMKMDYAYYYDHDEQGHHQGYEAHDHSEFVELAQKTAGIHAINFDKALTGNEIKEVIDIKGEGNDLVRTLEVDSLPSAYIRMYNDLQVYPGEKEISTAMTTMLEGVVKIGFLTGHGERDLDRTGDKDYNGYPNSRKDRGSLINNGFDPISLTLDKPIPTDVTIIVIADMRIPFSADEFKQIEGFIERGGNLVINIDVNQTERMGELLQVLGIEAVSGVLAQKNAGYSPANVFTVFTENSTKINPGFTRFIHRTQIIMPGAVGLVKKEDKGYDVVSVLEAKAGTWNEPNISNPDEIVIDSTAEVDTTAIYRTALALTRNKNDKEQRILIFGDADWFSKGELNANRSFGTGNHSMIINMFKWMAYDKYPISFDRPPLPDNELYFKFQSKGIANFFFLFLFPSLWLVWGTIVWYQRKIK